jgi:hypothetical protein
VLDAPGFVRYPATQAFGNFRWDGVSQQVEAITRGQACQCSVWIPQTSKYRVWFTDGTSISGAPVAKGQFEWTTIDYGRRVMAAVHAEIAGNARTFVGGDDGWVYECDVGRSFDGQPIQYALRLNELSQRSPGIVKQYSRLALEAQAQSAFTLAVAADFYGGDDDEIDPTEPVIVPQYGAGLLWDLANWDQSYWDVNDSARKRFPLEGSGTSVAISIGGQSDNEAPHTLRAVTISYIMRRQAR